MPWLLVNPNSVWSKTKCMHCNEPGKPGQLALVKTYIPARTGGIAVDTLQHKTCLEAALASPDMPVESSEIELQKRRTAIIDSGDPYLIGVN